MVSIPAANLNGGLKAATSGAGGPSGVPPSVLANAPRVYLSPAAASTFMANRQAVAGASATTSAVGAVGTSAGTVRYFSQFSKLQKLANGDTLVLAANGSGKSMILASGDKTNGNHPFMSNAKTQLLDEERETTGAVTAAGMGTATGGTATATGGTVISDEESRKSGSSHPHQTDQAEPLELVTQQSNSSVAQEANEAETDVEPELDIVINNVVCSFSVRCHLKLRDIALNGANVEYRRENGMVTMKLRHPYTTASIWSSGRITCTGATSESMAKVAARRYARCLGKLGFPTRFQNFRIVNVLGTCSMPWAIKIVNFSERHRDNASYEPELHPGVTYKMRDPKATLKIFSTGSITVTAASVNDVEAAIQHIYPLVHEFRKQRSPEELAHLRHKQRLIHGHDPVAKEATVIAENKVAGDHNIFVNTVGAHTKTEAPPVASALANTPINSASTSSTASSSSDNICANARRRATECWASKLQNKRPRYNDAGPAASPASASASSTSASASAPASSSSAAAASSQSSHLRNPLKTAALANARMRGGKLPVGVVLKNSSSRARNAQLQHQQQRQLQLQQQQKLRQTSFSPSDFQVDDIIIEEESNELDMMPY
ncbi:hypothetical protein KR009_010288 [Drosophila setifemur]|nr:hypothetical protein KR009_010288 [Drosophila setifemur]